MKSYFRIFLLGLQTQLQYRVNLFGWMLVNFIPTIVFILVWLVILGNKTHIQGFSKSDFILYYLFTTAIWYIVGGNFARAIGDAIRDGEMNKNLLKPYNVLFEKFMLEQAWKCMSLLVVIPASGIILWYFRDIFTFTFSFSMLFYLLLSLILGGIIFALIEIIVGLSGFWFTEIWSIAYVSEVVLELFGGRMAPIDLMPPWLQTISHILPFKYIFYTPTAILLNKSPNPPVDIAIQCLYVVLLYVIYKVLFAKGIARYEAIGG